jgi:hypothetical protein
MPLTPVYLVTVRTKTDDIPVALCESKEAARLVAHDPDVFESARRLNYIQPLRSLSPREVCITSFVNGCPVAHEVVRDLANVGV